MKGQIVRRNGVRTLSVITQVKRGFNETNMQKKVEKVMNSRVIPNLPEGVSFEYGGVKESDEEIITPIIEGLSIAVIIVFLFLLINYKKIGLAVAALTSILLCLFGAALGLWVRDGVQYHLCVGYNQFDRYCGT